MKNHLRIIGLCLVYVCGAVSAEQPENRPDGWLVDAENDTERFVLLQRYLRGFDQPMWEVGERFQSIHTALNRENYDLAAYHWDKIRSTIKNGYLKRPARQANADNILLNETWEEVKQTFASRNRVKAWEGFATAKAACMACHTAESVPFMNNQPLFELASPLEKVK